ncbi:hypothetical protein FXW78_51625 [Rhodococcus opacus]|nr:hypothetical protein [Rhodococcus opacus]
MITWILWTGAALVVGRLGCPVKTQPVAARVLWVLAALTFVAAAIGVLTASVISLPLLVTVVIAIVATLMLVKVTNSARVRTPRR